MTYPTLGTLTFDFGLESIKALILPLLIIYDKTLSWS